MSSPGLSLRRGSRRRALVVAVIALVLVPSRAGADHVTVYDQCAGPQDGQAVVALSVSLPRGSIVEGFLYGETGEQQAAGTVADGGIVELRFELADPAGFYEWVTHDAAQPDHLIASGGLDGSGPSCGGSQLRRAPTTTEPSPTTTTEPSTTTTTTTTTTAAPPPEEPVQAAPSQPVLPPPAPEVPVATPTTTSGGTAVTEPVEEEEVLALPATVDGGSAGFGGDTETVVLVPAASDEVSQLLAVPTETTDAELLDWLAFLTATLVILWLGVTSRTSVLALTADRLISKQRPD